jgi:hypothetical protein
MDHDSAGLLTCSCLNLSHMLRVWVRLQSSSQAPYNIWFLLVVCLRLSHGTFSFMIQLFCLIILLQLRNICRWLLAVRADFCHCVMFRVPNAAMADWFGGQNGTEDHLRGCAPSSDEGVFCNEGRGVQSSSGISMIASPARVASVSVGDVGDVGD